MPFLDEEAMDFKEQNVQHRYCNGDMKKRREVGDLGSAAASERSSILVCE